MAWRAIASTYTGQGRDLDAFTCFSCICPVTEGPAGIIPMTWRVHSLCSPFLVPPGWHEISTLVAQGSLPSQQGIIGYDHDTQRLSNCYLCRNSSQQGSERQAISLHWGTSNSLWIGTRLAHRRDLRLLARVVCRYPASLATVSCSAQALSSCSV